MMEPPRPEKIFEVLRVLAESLNEGIERLDREIKRLDEALDPRRGAARSVFEEILGEVKG
ncbi:MAG: hypothetical protein JRD89_13265, partial [Deltaproteobacteria bacterium]|nr:hypothetical protein [Deltaproteobacteria bacterium]